MRVSIHLILCLVTFLLACWTSPGCADSIQPTPPVTASEWRRDQGICEVHRQELEIGEPASPLDDPSEEAAEALAFFPNSGASLSAAGGDDAKQPAPIPVCVQCIAGLEQWQRTPRPQLPERDLAVLEEVLRQQLSEKKRGDVVFISVGSVLTDWKDPPRALRQNLGELPPEILPVSFARHPKSGEEASMGHFRGVEDPRTGKQAKIYWAEIKAWDSDTKVRVDTGVWSGPLGGGGSIYIMELKDGKWEIVGDEAAWVS
jgi:hypothetical protein